jgi:ribosome-associated protein
MRTLADRKNEQAKADADDRDLESRTDRRRQQDAHETMLKTLATRLCNLKPSALERLELDEESLAAVRTARSIRSAPARNRQVNVVRQHLRALGPALAELVQKLDAPARLASPSAAAVAPSRAPSAEVKGWGERLIEGGDNALAELLALHPATDRQLLRQRMRELSRLRAGGSESAIAAAEARFFASITAALRS